MCITGWSMGCLRRHGSFSKHRSSSCPLRTSAFPLPCSRVIHGLLTVAAVDIVIVFGSCLPLIELETRSDLLVQLTMSLPHDQIFELISPMRTGKAEEEWPMLPLISKLSPRRSGI